MIVEKTSRLICKTEMAIKNGIPVSPSDKGTSRINILELKPKTGMEYGFLFYEAEHEQYVCQIHFENKRRDFEISYGTEAIFRGNGFMKEALQFFVQWIFTNTSVTQMCALISNNPISQHILMNYGFIFEKHDEYGDWFVITKP